jgi:hypothetical protein
LRIASYNVEYFLLRAMAMNWAPVDAATSIVEAQARVYSALSAGERRHVLAPAGDANAGEAANEHPAT